MSTKHGGLRDVHYHVAKESSRRSTIHWPSTERHLRPINRKLEADATRFNRARGAAAGAEEDATAPYRRDGEKNIRRAWRDQRNTLFSTIRVAYDHISPATVNGTGRPSRARNVRFALDRNARVVLLHGVSESRNAPDKMYLDQTTPTSNSPRARADHQDKLA